MAEEKNNIHVTNETERLIKKELAHQQTEMFTKFSKILMQFSLTSRESSTRSHSNKIIPLKVKMNLDILNIECNIEVESFDNWVRQLESYYSVNRFSKAEKITIASSNTSTSVHCWWENLSTYMEWEGDPIDTWHKFVAYIWKELYSANYIEQQYKKWKQPRKWKD